MQSSFLSLSSRVAENTTRLDGTVGKLRVKLPCSTPLTRPLGRFLNGIGGKGRANTF